MSGFDLSKENFEDAYCKAANGVYILSETHAFGGNKHLFPLVNNRGFVFEVTKKGENRNHLLMYGIPGFGLIPSVQQIEKETGLKLEVVVGSGDFHHLSMKEWLTAFPETKFIHSALKFPSTRNGGEILKNEEWKARIELCEGPSFPSLEPYSETLSFFGFNQCLTPPDAPFTPKNIHEPSKLSLFQYLRNVASLKATERMLAVWCYHHPTKQLIYEHNFDFFLSANKVKQFPFPLKFVLPREKLQSAVGQPVTNAPKDLEGCKIHCQTMAKVLELDVRAIVDFHSDPGLQACLWDSKEAFKKDFTRILSATGEDDIDGDSLMQAMNGSRCNCLFHSFQKKDIQCKEVNA